MLCAIQEFDIQEMVESYRAGISMVNMNCVEYTTNIRINIQYIDILLD